MVVVQMRVVVWVFKPCRLLCLTRHFGVILPPSSGWMNQFRQMLKWQRV